MSDEAPSPVGLIGPIQNLTKALDLMNVAWIAGDYDAVIACAEEVSLAGTALEQAARDAVDVLRLED